MYLVKATFYTLEFVEASCLVGVRWCNCKRGKWKQRIHWVRITPNDCMKRSPRTNDCH